LSLQEVSKSEQKNNIIEKNFTNNTKQIIEKSDNVIASEPLEKD